MKEVSPLIADDILNSKIAMAVLRLLIERDMHLPISRIAKEIGSNYIAVRKQMKLLEEADLVTSVQYGKRTLYKTNNSNQRINALKSFVEVWNNPKAT